ncbi:MAG: DoxX family membrane protein [Opitutaceae bacterium]|nr:DoxX family membrane protein [Opitutaceae bacterium]
MTTTQSTVPDSGTAEHQAVRQIRLTLKVLFGIVPIVAGADKFTNILARWPDYLNPHLASISPFSPSAFMHVVGVIEIVAGLLVFLKPRIGAYVVAAWLIAIALQLIVQGHYLDVAVRDIVLALGGAWPLARLSSLDE